MPIRHPVRIVLAGLGLGLAFDRLVVNHALGAGFLSFVVLVLAALAATLAWEQLKPIRQNLWIFVPLLFFAAMLAVRANGFITFLNLAAVLLLLCVIAAYLLRERLTRVNLPGYALAPLLAPVMAAVRGAETSYKAGVATASNWRSHPQRRWLPVLRGVLLASPVVLVFALLLSSADLMFAEVLRRLLPVDFLSFIRDLISHGVIVLLVGFVLLGGLAYSAWREERSVEASVLSFSVPPVLGLTESAILLNAVNLLFAAFVIIQVPYLFGGQLNIDLGQVTYAEYARRGFGELVVTSVLVLGMLLALGAITRCENARQHLIFNLSSTATVGLTVVMLVSAFKRLLLYEQAYGFTEMRLYPHVFMIWLAVLLGWFLLTLWIKPGRFAIGLVVACIGFVATLNVINVDSLIVRENMQRYARLGAAAFAAPRDYQKRGEERIDVEYFTALSDDAVPALALAATQLEDGPRGKVSDFLLRRYWAIHDTPRGDWRDFNYSRWNAYRALVLWRNSQH